MEKKDLIPQGDAIHYLKLAALYPQRRGEMMARALQEFLLRLPAVGTALVWPCKDRKVSWKVYYAGTRSENMRRWLTDRLNSSLNATLSVLQRDLISLPDMPVPHLISLRPTPMVIAGLWIIWSPISPLSREALDYLEEVRQTLEALIEVESLEEHYFSSTSPLSDHALVEALGRGDPNALSAILSLTRLVGNADLTFWGRAYQDVVETTDHMGAKQSGFGLAVPRGQGIGGRIAAYGTPPIAIVEDYRNSLYRYPIASAIADSEQIRSGIVLPIHSRIGEGRTEPVAGILYVTRRTVKPFSLVEQLLVQRITTLLEPLSPLTRPTSFPSLGLPLVPDQKAAWHKLILQADRMESLETWVGQFIQGTIIVTDRDGHPYGSAHSQQLEQLRAAFNSSIDGVQVISLAAPGVSFPGQVYLRSAIALPPPKWSNFFADLVMACNLIIGRMEQAHDRLTRQREQWLRAVLQGESLPQIRQDGNRLGLPVGEGRLWVIAWPSQGQGVVESGLAPNSAPTTRQLARKRMLAENMVLDQLESLLLFLGDDIGVILLGGQTEPDPSRLHDSLLTLFAPYPLWIVHGARYHSPHDLKMVLTHCISQAQKARRERNSKFLLDVQTPGLENLLANPKLSEDLRDFATKLLKPLLEYDRSKGTDLTTTFVLARMLGSTQAVSDELGVHVNTIRYRLHKAEDILGIEEASPKERIAWGVASFIWTSFHPVEPTPSYSSSQTD